MLDTIWILTDGKIGDVVQCRGIAAHLDAKKVEERVVAPQGVWALPVHFMPLPPADRPDRAGSPIHPPYPDLVLASGRRTIPYLRAIKTAAPRTKTVFLKDPRWPGRSVPDFIWAPVHDRLKTDGSRIIATHTSPHGLTADRLSGARDGRLPLEPGFDGLILGGDSGAVKWSAESSAAFADLLSTAFGNGTAVAVTPSRRTPAVLSTAVGKALPNAWFDSDGSHYLPILAQAGRIVVTGDSHNMVSEALATGAPVHVYRPPALQPKLQGFLDAMRAEGAIRDFDGVLVDFPAKRRDATAEIAQSIRAAL